MENNGRNFDNSILNTVKVLTDVGNPTKDGVEYINVSRNGQTELGQMLAPGYSYRFSTFLGKTYNITSFLNAITIKGYNLSLLNKRSLSRGDIKSIPRGRDNRVSVPNYWSLLGYAVCSRVQADPKLQALMKANKLPYTCLDNIETTDFMGGISIQIAHVKTAMIRYIAIIELIAKMLKEDRFDRPNIEEFVVALKSRPDKDLLDGLACADKMVINR